LSQAVNNNNMRHGLAWPLVVVSTAILLLGIVDTFLFLRGGYDATITATVREVSQQQPLVPLLVGLVFGLIFGHLFWSR
jgi:hypothetical protein